MEFSARPGTISYRALSALLGAVITSVLAVGASPAQAAPPEFGRCVQVTPGLGGYRNAGCTLASARGEYQWLPGPGPNNHFTGNYGYSFIEEDAVLRTNGSGPWKYIDCQDNIGEGEYTGPKTLTLTITLVGCHVLHDGPWEWQYACQDLVNPAPTFGGQITMELSGKLGFYKTPSGGRKVGIELTPRHGSNVALFECGGANGLTWGSTGKGTLLGLEGGMIEQIKAAYEGDRSYNRMMLEYETKFDAEGTSQFPESLEGGAKDTLTLARPPVGIEKTTEPALFTAGEEVDEIEEPIEINLRV